jgi:hypothetical protein
MYPPDQNTKNAKPDKIMVIISWEFLKQRPKRELRARNFPENKKILNPLTLVKLLS